MAYYQLKPIRATLFTNKEALEKTMKEWGVQWNVGIPNREGTLPIVYKNSVVYLSPDEHYVICDENYLPAVMEAGLFERMYDEVEKD